MGQFGQPPVCPDAARPLPQTQTPRRSFFIAFCSSGKASVHAADDRGEKEELYSVGSEFQCMLCVPGRGRPDTPTIRF